MTWVSTSITEWPDGWKSIIPLSLSRHWSEVWAGEAGSQRNSMLGDWDICTTNEPGQVKMIKLIFQLNIDKTNPPPPTGAFHFCLAVRGFYFKWTCHLLRVTTLNHCFVFQERNTNKCQLTDLALEDLMNMVLRWCWCWKDQKDQAHSMIRNLCLPVFIADNCRTLVSFMFTKIVKFWAFLNLRHRFWWFWCWQGLNLSTHILSVFCLECYVCCMVTETLSTRPCLFMSIWTPLVYLLGRSCLVSLSLVQCRWKWSKVQ